MTRSYKSLIVGFRWAHKALAYAQSLENLHGSTPAAALVQRANGGAVAEGIPRPAIDRASI